MRNTLSRSAATPLATPLQSSREQASQAARKSAEEKAVCLRRDIEKTNFSKVNQIDSKIQIILQNQNKDLLLIIINYYNNKIHTQLDLAMNWAALATIQIEETLRARQGVVQDQSQPMNHTRVEKLFQIRKKKSEQTKQ